MVDHSTTPPHPEPEQESANPEQKKGLRAIPLPAPLRSRSFRLLWSGMAFSYAGDRLQELAQGWLVALMTGSALAVGGIGIVAAIPQMLMPLGGVIADQVDRRRLMMAGQALGAVVSAAVGLLVWQGRALPWHIYTWALVAGLVWMLMRPAYKAALTLSVPAPQVRQAVSINAITETSMIMLMNGLGGLLVAATGLPVAFAVNAATYLIAIACLWQLPPQETSAAGLSPRQVLHDLLDGLRCLRDTPGLLYPMLQTSLMMLCLSPAFSLLPAIVEGSGGTVVRLGIMGAATSLGSFTGSIIAGMSSEGSAVRTYALLGLGCAAAQVVFVLNPLSPLALLALAVTGTLLFSQAVWNTSRIPRLAAPAFQARLQSLGTMAFTLGGALGALWGGLVVDRFGLPYILIGGGLLAVISLITLLLRTEKSLVG